MTKDVDTSGWPRLCVVRTEDLRVEAVEHEVVEWDASFCSEDVLPLSDEHWDAIVEALTYVGDGGERDPKFDEVLERLEIRR